jgi:hypothetical protein
MDFAGALGQPPGASAESVRRPTPDSARRSSPCPPAACEKVALAGCLRAAATSVLQQARFCCYPRASSRYATLRMSRSSVDRGLVMGQAPSNKFDQYKSAFEDLATRMRISQDCPNCTLRRLSACVSHQHNDPAMGNPCFSGGPSRPTSGPTGGSSPESPSYRFPGPAPVRGLVDGQGLIGWMATVWLGAVVSSWIYVANSVPGHIERWATEGREER